MQTIPWASDCICAVNYVLMTSALLCLLDQFWLVNIVSMSSLKCKMKTISLHAIKNKESPGSVIKLEFIIQNYVVKKEWKSPKFPERAEVGLHLWEAGLSSNVTLLGWHVKVLSMVGQGCKEPSELPCVLQIQGQPAQEYPRHHCSPPCAAVGQEDTKNSGIKLNSLGRKG